MANIKPAIEEWLNPEKLDKIYEWASDGLSMKEIADNIGISRTLLYMWTDKSMEILNTIKKGKEKADEIVENALYNNAVKNNNVTAQIFWLKNRKPEQWKEKQEIDSNKEMLDKLDQLLEEQKNGYMDN